MATLAEEIARPKVSRSLAEELVNLTSRGVLHLVIIGVALLWLTPSVGLLITSFRPPREITTSGWWNIPSVIQHFNFENYVSVILARPVPGDAPLTPPGFETHFFNSLLITIPSTLLPILVASLAAYAFTWMKFPGRNSLYLLIVALIVVPLQTTWVAVLQIYNALGINGTFPGLWIAHTAYGTPFAVFLMRNFFAELPSEIIDSARVDGASDRMVFLRIVLPLSVPALASLAIFQFVWVWNDLINAKIYLADVFKYPLTLGIERLLLQYGGKWHILSAGALISMSVPLLIFFTLQRYFVRGVTAGSVKG